MRGLLALLATGSTGCQVLFPLEEPPPVPCTTKARALVDNLEAGPPVWDEFPMGNLISYDAGGVHLAMGAGGTTFIRHSVLYDLRQSTFSIEVDPNVTLGFDDEINFSLLAADFDGGGTKGHAVTFIRRNGKLIANYFEEGAENDIKLLDFDPIAHRTWQISRDRDTTSWAVVGADGKPVVVQTFDLPWATFLAPQLVAARADTSSFTATFRNLNAGVEPDEVCGAEQLIDRFEGVDIDRDTWGRSGARFESGCRFGVDGGDLAVTFELDGAVSDSCSFGSSGVYDLVNHTFTVEVDATLPSMERVVA